MCIYISVYIYICIFINELQGERFEEDYCDIDSGKKIKLGDLGQSNLGKR